VSRTIRRTKRNKLRSRSEKTYTHVRLTEYLDLQGESNRWYNHGFPLVPLEGKEFQKTYWKFHSDCGCPEFGFENAFEYPWVESSKEARARYKREIVKWLKDEDYEIIFTKPPHIWDYC
jgi:hypothetical protein